MWITPDDVQPNASPLEPFNQGLLMWNGNKYSLKHLPPAYKNASWEYDKNRAVK